MVHFKGLEDQKDWAFLTNTMPAVQFSEQNLLVQLIINLFTLGIKGEREH